MTMCRILGMVGLLIGGLAGAGCGDEDDCGTCIRAVECVEECGGEVVSSSCCPCPEGTMDVLECETDGG